MLNLSLRNYYKVSFNTNTLFYGDNLEILEHLVPNESIDLIYLDPPFNSKADYNVLFKETGMNHVTIFQVLAEYLKSFDAIGYIFQEGTTRQLTSQLEQVVQKSM